MKRFKLFTLISLLAFIPAAIFAEEARAKSAKCVVNTCDLHLETVANASGILLRWDFTESGYEANIYRAPSILPDKTIDAKVGVYFDPDVKYGVTYEYIVDIVPKNSSWGTPTLTASIRATRFSDKAPTVSSIETAPLWLEKEGPYNVRIELSDDYDKTRYTVTEIGFTIDGKTKWVKYAPSGEYDLSSEFTFSSYGTVKLRARCKYDDAKAKKKNEISTFSKELKAHVLFHKYGKGGYSHCWFDNWKADKAVAELNHSLYSFTIGNARMESKVLHSPNDVVQGYCNTSVGSITYEPVSFVVGARNVTLPGLTRRANFREKTLMIDEVHGASHTTENIVNNKNVTGIEATAAICSHEMFHRQTTHNLCFTKTNAKRDYRFINVPDVSDDVRAAIENYRNSNLLTADKRETLTAWHDALVQKETIDKNGFNQLSIDADDDGVLDRDEKAWGSIVSPHRTNSEYEDFEYVAYRNSSAKGANREKDYAFPGTKAGRDYEHYTQTEWRPKIREYTAALQKLPAKSKGAALLPNAAKVANSILQTDNNDSSKDKTTYARIDELPDMANEDATGKVMLVSAGSGAAQDAAGGVYSNLVFELTLKSNSAEDKYVVLEGCLADETGAPIVGATKGVEVKAGEQVVVTLPFAAEFLYESKSRGFQLKTLTISEYEGCASVLCDFKENVAMCDQEYAYSDFAPKGGYIYEKTIQSRKTDSGLALSMDIEVFSGSTCTILAELRDTNGVYIATARKEGLCSSGVQHVDLEIPGRELMLAKINGPYNIFRIEIVSDGGEILDAKVDTHLTDTYDYREFSDGSETILADAESFARGPDTIGADGLCDALNFSFVVSNAAPSTAVYTVGLALCNENDELVGSCSKEIELSQPINHIEVSYAGLDIKASGIEGPYYVSEVLIDDGSDVVEKFSPDKVMIAHRLDDFGEAPVELNGTVIEDETSDEVPFSVVVPIRALRAGAMTARAVLMTESGQAVLSSEATREFAQDEKGSLAISFRADDINATGIRGPYVIQCLAIGSCYEGTAEIYVEDLGFAARDRQFVLYVDSENGNDENNGCSRQAPFATIDYAVSVSKPGDLILVADGIYEPFFMDGQNLVVRSINGPERTIVDAKGHTTCVYFQNRHFQDEGGVWTTYDASTCVVEGLTLRNGLAYEGGGIYRGHARNCIITGCKAKSGGGGAYRSTLENCIVYGNTSKYAAGGVYGGELYNCTVSRNDARYVGGVCGARVYNSIVWGNNFTKSDPWTHWNYDETGEFTSYGDDLVFERSCTYPTPEDGEGNINDDPQLADPLHGDMRLRSFSPCVDAGSIDLARTKTDIYGAARVQNTAPEIGAVENRFEDRHCVCVAVKGNGRVEPEVAFIADGGEVNIMAYETGGGQFLGYETIDGDQLLASNAMRLQEVRGSLDIVAVFRSGGVYVSPEGDDANNGLSWATAKATIQAAVDVAEDGDTIYVAGGVYSPFTATSRAIAIKSIGGADATVIDAQGAGSCAIMSADAKLHGFTLRNGHAYGNGGGARGGTLYDCKIVGNRVAGNGGGLANATAYRCVISGNTVEKSQEGSWGKGGGAYECDLYNCLVVDNRIEIDSEYFAWTGGAGVSGYSLYNCTVADNAIVALPTNKTAFDASGGGIADAACFNTISWGNTVTGVVSNAENAYIDDTLWYKEDPCFVGNGDYRLKASSPCIDIGDGNYAKGDIDLIGRPRISGAAVDCGAYEYAQSGDASIMYRIAFDPNEGEGQMPEILVAVGAPTPLPKNAFGRGGYIFAGWAVAQSGNVVFRDGDTVVNLAVEDDALVRLYAVWVSMLDRVRLSFNATGGMVSISYYDLQWGTAVETLPVPVRDGWMFSGWYTSLTDGRRIAEPLKIEADMTLYARWIAIGNPSEPVAPARTEEAAEAIAGTLELFPAGTAEATTVEKFEQAAQYDGYVLKGETLAGTVLVKVAKAGKTPESKVTAMVQLVGQKKTTYKGVVDATGRCTMDDMSLVFGREALSGTVGNLEIRGSRNMFAAKDANSKAMAAAAMKTYKNAYTVAWQQGGPWGSVTVTVGNKGKAKITGFLPDGTKISANGQLMLGESAACVTVVSTNKKAPLAFNLWLLDGTAVASGLGTGAIASKVGVLSSDKAFTCSLLTESVPVMVNGKKWTVATDNATALKLSYTPKTGAFKGSFKVGKAKAAVNGVVVDGLGYGSAVIKKDAKAAVTIE